MLVNTFQLHRGPIISIRIQFFFAVKPLEIFTYTMKLVGHVRRKKEVRTTFLSQHLSYTEVLKRKPRGRVPLMSL